MSVECEPTPRPCRNIFLPTFSIQAPYMCQPNTTISNLIANVVANRAIYSSIPCSCIQEYDLKVVQGIITCGSCKIPNTPCLIDDACRCIIDPSLMQSNAVNVIVSKYPYGEEPFFGELLACALQFSDLSDIFIFSTNAIFTLQNFQELIQNGVMANPNPNFEATIGFTNTPSRLLSVAIYDSDVIATIEPGYRCCDGATTASVRYVLGVSACIRLLNYNPSTFVNTKEDYEVLKGLWIGRYAHEEFHDVHTIKRAKVADLI